MLHLRIVGVHKLICMKFLSAELSILDATESKIMVILAGGTSILKCQSHFYSFFAMTKFIVCKIIL